MVTRWATPKWAHKLPIPPLRRLLFRMTLSYQELERHLQQLIADSRASLEDEKTPVGKREALGDDLLRRLVESNALEEDPKKRLTDEELLSNVFVSIPPSLYDPDACLTELSPRSSWWPAMVCRFFL